MPGLPGRNGTDGKDGPKVSVLKTNGEEKFCCKKNSYYDSESTRLNCVCVSISIKELLFPWSIPSLQMFEYGLVKQQPWSVDSPFQDCMKKIKERSLLR